MKLLKELAIGFALGALFILVFIFFTLTAAIPADAQNAEPVCADREALTFVLADRWGESARSVGLVSSGELVLEVYANIETGTWTLASTSPEGEMCIIIAGQDYSEVRLPQGQPS